MSLPDNHPGVKVQTWRDSPDGPFRDTLHFGGWTPSRRQNRQDRPRRIREGQEGVYLQRKRRLIAYIGSQTASVGEIVRWNLVDWGQRLTGRFRNELGAHAGFSAGELAGLLKATFTNFEDRTRDYLDMKYRSRMISALGRSPLGGILAPRDLLRRPEGEGPGLRIFRYHLGKILRLRSWDMAPLGLDFLAPRGV